MYEIVYIDNYIVGVVIGCVVGVECSGSKVEVDICEYFCKCVDLLMVIIGVVDDEINSG